MGTSRFLWGLHPTHPAVGLLRHERWIAIHAPAARIPGPQWRIDDAGREAEPVDRRQLLEHAAVDAVVADAKLVPGEVVTGASDAERVALTQDAAGSARRETQLHTIVVLADIDRTATLRPAEVTAPMLPRAVVVTAAATMSPGLEAADDRGGTGVRSISGF